MRDRWAVTQETKEAQLGSAAERWRTLYQAGDWTALRTLYADDAVLMTQGQKKIEGADNILAFLQRLTNAGAAVTFTFEPEENLVSGGYGFATDKYRMDIAFPDREPTIVMGRSFLVYEWNGSEWKLWRDMDNFAPDVTKGDFQ
jgi:ketosteroid isomerase-like protein